MKKILLFVTVIISVMFISGCGQRGISVVPVTGEVTCGGEPLAGALVTFIPAEGSQSDRSASAETNAEGGFALYTLAAEKPGALPGDYVVLIEKTAATGGAGGANPVVTVVTPKRYARPNTTPLTATVEKRGKNHFVLEMGTK
jgi:hypothetical protein